MAKAEEIGATDLGKDHAPRLVGADGFPQLLEGPFSPGSGSPGSGLSVGFHALLIFQVSVPISALLRGGSFLSLFFGGGELRVSG